MHDLKKVEEKFHEYLKTRLNEKTYRIDEIKITEELLEKQEAFYIPFGWISYFLVIEDGKPEVYANACSRMDLDMIAIIDENGYEDYDVWGGDHPDITRKYRSHAGKVKRFNYDNLKFISDIKK
jgi:hypothetical protein